MDVNGTRFHLLLGVSDWGRCSLQESGEPPLGEVWAAPGAAPPPVTYDSARDELTLRPLPFRFRAPDRRGAPAPLDPSVRRGAAADRYGNWYWIDTDITRILVSSSGSGRTSVLWATGGTVATTSRARGDFVAAETPAPPVPLRLGGAAVTLDHYLLVGVTEPAGLLVFDLQAGGPPEQVLWPAGVGFSPFDMAARPGGGVFVLDQQNRRYWELDRHFFVVSRRPPGPGSTSPAFEPATGQPQGSPAPTRWAGPVPADAVSIAGAAEVGAPGALAIESLPGGTVLILLRDEVSGPSAVAAYRDGALLGTAPTRDADISIAGHDVAVVSGTEPACPGGSARLFVVDGGGDQSFEFCLTFPQGAPQLALLPRYFPMRLFGGKALVATEGQAFYDFEDRWLPLVEQRRQQFEARAVLFTQLLDGGEPACVWHRLMLDACLPTETGVTVWSAADDDPKALSAFPRWMQEPAPYPRGDGSELVGTHADPSAAYRTWELLFQRAQGRYLRLRLELDGNGRASPRIRALRAHYPRFSYLHHYLPAVYREDELSASFLDRYLANIEGVSTAVEDRMAAVQALFDARTTPGEALDWLASWFGLVLDPGWDERKRRLLIAHAMDLFQWRGTARGLQAVLGLAFETDPDSTLFSEAPDACVRRTRIVELYQSKLTPGVALGDPTAASAAAPAPAGRWRPADGPYALHSGYASALRLAGLPADERTAFPVTEPSDPGDPDTARKAAVWREFAQRTLGFVPSSDPANQAWRDFLARRYIRALNLNAAYGWVGSAAIGSFEEAGLFAELPDRDPALTDWFQFQSVVLLSYRTAGRFRVLLPVSAKTRAASEPQSASDRALDVELARRVVDLEKPAHTVFDVKFYWEAFRVGEARLGLDTLVDLGSRSPGLLSGAVLDHSYLGQSVLQSRMAEVAGTRLPVISHPYCP
ncbi:MAG: hypothetical protein QOH66_1557 [Actinomycetota bacterium]|jgi:phage tail-like protein|nr:hypothetical protein [Actinomycetota bacterium]